MTALALNSLIAVVTPFAAIGAGSPEGVFGERRSVPPTGTAELGSDPSVVGAAFEESIGLGPPIGGETPRTIFEMFTGSGSVDGPATIAGLLNAYMPVFAIAFVVVLLATPIVRRVAVHAGIIDRPDGDGGRKVHTIPIAYLGGVAVLLGILAGVALSYLEVCDGHPNYAPIPLAVVIGALAIAVTGLADDVWGWDPRLKIAGQLVAAAALAIENVGVNVAAGVLAPIFGVPDDVLFSIGQFALTAGHVYYWTGTFLIAVFVIGGCNAANLIDGLDGLLTGSTAIMAVGFLAISIFMALALGDQVPFDSLAGARVVLSLALLGATLGFLPYNFNPAVIFLGDTGSLLIGYLCVVIILMFGEQGQTHLVFAGLIVFSLPIMDAMLAIIRRKLAGVSMSDADRNHIHHQLHRGLRTVRRAVVALYGVTFAFTVVGVGLAGLVMFSSLRVRFVYAVALALFGMIGALAVKAARRAQWEQTHRVD